MSSNEVVEVETDDDVKIFEKPKDPQVLLVDKPEKKSFLEVLGKRQNQIDHENANRIEKSYKRVKECTKEIVRRVADKFGTFDSHASIQASRKGISEAVQDTGVLEKSYDASSEKLAVPVIVASKLHIRRMSDFLSHVHAKHPRAMQEYDSLESKREAWLENEKKKGKHPMDQIDTSFLKGYEQEYLNAAVAQLITNGRLAINAGESSYLREYTTAVAYLFAKKRVPGNKAVIQPLKLPGHMKVTKLLSFSNRMTSDKLAESLREQFELAKDWPEGSKGSLANISLDCWDSPSGDHMLAGFHSYIDLRTGEYCCNLLMFDKIKSTARDQLANHVRRCLRTLAEQFGLDEDDLQLVAFVGDGAGNNGTLSRALGIQDQCRVHCLAHRLSLAVKGAIGAMVDKAKASQKLKTLLDFGMTFDLSPLTFQGEAEKPLYEDDSVMIPEPFDADLDWESALLSIDGADCSNEERATVAASGQEEDQIMDQEVADVVGTLGANSTTIEAILKQAARVFQFFNKSSKQREILKSWCEDLKIKYCALGSVSKTRWNGLYMRLKSYFDMKPAIHLTIRDYQVKVLSKNANIKEKEDAKSAKAMKSAELLCRAGVKTHGQLLAVMERLNALQTSIQADKVTLGQGLLMFLGFLCTLYSKYSVSQWRDDTYTPTKTEDLVPAEKLDPSVLGFLDQVFDHILKYLRLPEILEREVEILSMALDPCCRLFLGLKLQHNVLTENVVLLRKAAVVRKSLKSPERVKRMDSVITFVHSLRERVQFKLVRFVSKFVNRPDTNIPAAQSQQLPEWKDLDAGLDLLDSTKPLASPLHEQHLSRRDIAETEVRNYLSALCIDGIPEKHVIIDLAISWNRSETPFVFVPNEAGISWWKTKLLEQNEGREDPRTNAERFPNIRRAQTRIMGIMASSSRVESLFSREKHHQADHRKGNMGITNVSTVVRGRETMFTNPELAPTPQELARAFLDEGKRRASNTNS